MTSICLCLDGCHLHLEIRGHADYAEKGKDIVCAAITAYTTQFSYIINEHKDWFDFVSEDIHSGYYEAIAQIGENIVSSTKGDNPALFHIGVFLLFVNIGFCFVSDCFPQNVEIVPSVTVQYMESPT